MSSNLSKRKEAPITMSMIQGDRIEFVFKVGELVAMRRACQALRDFRHAGVENMRKFHANNKLLSVAIEGVASEEEIIRDLHMIIYGPEAEKLTQEELTNRTREYKEVHKAYITRDHPVSLYIISNAVFEEPLKDETKFPKKTIDNVEVDTLIAYFDLCSEGIIV